ncbi:thiamine pyrophosphate-requiring protein [Salsipaludibacter albus]|uniref:thiamine pyrophosphate-requiring protein n=1 Tax=Salsipaludibacter albus TaxID=2849650 RepID=UPI001EE4B594|nr:thiamine pyrophosphate-requiring protein [Salsipaludibacter albus]MBY5161380.1 thiamine pyrophosphate-requiring protein [Salsipaludibacter albus]
MTTTVADALLQRLREWEVDRMFGYPGDGINGIHAAMQRADGPRFVQARHEELAAFMASGHARFTGQVGVCLATSGPGAIHLLNGLYDAKLDRQPVLAIVGAQATTARGGSYQQEVDLTNLYKDVAGAFLVEVTSPQQLPLAVDRAMRTALTRRTVTAIVVPIDVQEQEYVAPSHAFKMVPSSRGVVEPEISPPDDALDAAAELVNAGERVAVLVGQGARGAAAEVRELAELTGAGVAKALLGKDVLPDDLPWVTGPIGLLGSKPSWTLMDECDTFLCIGSNMPYTQFLPGLDQARAIDIDIDPHNIGLRYPFEFNLVGDAALTLRRLLPRIERKVDRSWRDKLEGEVAQWWDLVERRAMVDADPLNPQRVYWELSSRLPDDVIITADSGSGTNWFARDLRLREGMRASLSGTLATMGPAMPHAVGAKFAHPGRPVIATVGDGAMQMNGMNVLITIAKYWREWEDPRLVVLVLDNQDLNQVTWEMRAMGGFPKLEETQEVPRVDFVAFAESLGLAGHHLDDPDAVGPTWDRALSADRPTVVQARVDPDVPPIPPHVESDQVESLVKALLGGDRDAAGIISTGARERVQDFLVRMRS